jgi:hypothetical protein
LRAGRRQPECHASDIGCDLLVHVRFTYQDRSDVIHDRVVALAGGDRRVDSFGKDASLGWTPSGRGAMFSAVAEKAFLLFPRSAASD